MDIHISKENNNSDNICGVIKYCNYVKKLLGLPGRYKPNSTCNCFSFIKFAVWWFAFCHWLAGPISQTNFKCAGIWAEFSGKARSPGCAN
jgi:hypothetical protein